VPSPPASGVGELLQKPGSPEVEALSATCPHAGCFIELEGNARGFRCPCHNSQFSLDGGILEPSPSPRVMDSLECRVGPKGEVAGLYALQAEICVDEGLGLPTEVIVWDRVGGALTEVERYRFTEVKVNPTFPAGTFDPEHPAYSF